MKVFFSVGEPSGDIHGANLARELSRRVRGSSWSDSADREWPRPAASFSPT